MNGNSNIKFIVLSALLILASINLTRTTLEILKSSKKLDDAKNEITSLKGEQVKLESEIAYKKSDDFVDKTAREELNMIKPGEKVYVIKSEDQPAGDKQVVASNILGMMANRSTDEITASDRVKNLKDWVKLFF